MRLDLFVHHDAQLDRVERKLDRLLQETIDMAGEIDALKAEVLEFKREVAEQATAVSRVLARILALAQQLADALAANDPAAITAATSDLQAERAKLDALQAQMDETVPPGPSD